MIYAKDGKPYVIFKGRMIFPYNGLYVGDSRKFFGGGLGNVSRCIKANLHDAAVPILEDE